MDNRYISTPNFMSESEIYLHGLLEMNSNPEDLKSRMDMSSYSDDKDYEWLVYDDDNNTPSSISPVSTSFVTPRRRQSSSSGKRSKGRTKDDSNEAEQRLNRRREQNRESQQKFREKNRKAFEDVAQALQLERQTTSRLKAEVTVLQSTVVNLQMEKQNCLEAIQRLYGSMAEFRGAESQRDRDHHQC